MSSLQLAAFDLVRSLGRAKLTKKKILREKFTEKRINFVDRVCKQFLLCFDDKQSGSSRLVVQMRLMMLRVINNFGLDFKQFVHKEGVLDKIIQIIQGGVNYSQLEKRDALMTIKNLNYEASLVERAELDKKVTGEFLLGVLRSNVELRDQAIIIIK